MPVETPNVVTAEPEAERLIAAARHTIEEVPFFWVVTPGVEGGAHARIVQAQPSSDGEDFWVRWFLTPPNGRKARAPRLRAGQHRGASNPVRPNLNWRPGFRWEGQFSSYSRRKVTTRTSRWPGCAGSSGSIGVTP